MTPAYEQIEKAIKLVEQAIALIGSGPAGFYLKTLCEHSKALLTKFAPIKAGERCMIVKQIDCKDGWSGHEDNLAIGQVGIVKEVGYHDDLFRFAFQPDAQWWRDAGGQRHQQTRPSIYWLREGEIKPLALEPTDETA